MIESGNNPLAHSAKDAVGLWQFIPSTGNEWGLKISDHTDDRKDVIKSTHTAIRYLKYLYGQLNDWDLTLAAYNWGIGSVKKSLKTGLIVNGKLDLNKLPKETRRYLIAFHYLNQVIRLNESDPRFGKYENVEYLTIIKQSKLESHLHTHNMNTITPAVLRHMNGYDVWEDQGDDRDILVPTLEFTSHFSIQDILYKTSTKAGGSCGPKRYHKARYNETLSSVALMYKIRMDSLKDMNRGVNFLRPGMRIKICN